MYDLSLYVSSGRPLSWNCVEIIVVNSAISLFKLLLHNAALLTHTQLSFDTERKCMGVGLDVFFNTVWHWSDIRQSMFVIIMSTSRYQSSEININTITYPSKRKLSLEFKFCHFGNGRFAKFKSRLLLYYSKSLNAYMTEIQKSKLVNI